MTGSSHLPPAALTATHAGVQLGHRRLTLCLHPGLDHVKRRDCATRGLECMKEIGDSDVKASQTGGRHGERWVHTH